MADSLSCGHLAANLETISIGTGETDSYCNFCLQIANETRALRERVEALERALDMDWKVFAAIAEALTEPAGGEYWTARTIADVLKIYHDDLDGERVLLRLAKHQVEAARKLLEP